MTDSKPQSPAVASNFEDFGEGDEQVLACGGTEGDPHMIPMEINWDAATPHGVCPECGNRAFLHNQEVEEA